MPHYAYLRDNRYCCCHGTDLVPPGRTVSTRRYCPKCPEGSTLGPPVGWSSDELPLPPAAAAQAATHPNGEGLPGGPDDPVVLRLEVERLRARVAELEGELAAAMSTIAVLEDPELRAALSEPTSGDCGPVPDPRSSREAL